MIRCGLSLQLLSCRQAEEEGHFVSELKQRMVGGCIGHRQRAVRKVAVDEKRMYVCWGTGKDYFDHLRLIPVGIRISEERGAYLAL